jgi:hypothetical protein
MQTLKEKLNQQKLERLNQRTLDKEEGKKAVPVHFPFGKKSSPLKKVALETEPDQEEMMMMNLTDPK